MMSFEGPLHLKAVEFKTTEAGTDGSYVVTFTGPSAPEGIAEVAIKMAAGSVPEADLIKEGRSRCHALLTRLAAETQGWAYRKE